MKHIMVAFLFCFGVFGYSQSTPKLIIDTAYLQTLSEKSTTLKNEKALDSAIAVAKTLLHYAKSVRDTAYILNAYNKLASYHKRNNAPFDAVTFYTKAKTLYLEQGDTIKAVEKMRFIASLQKMLGDFYSSEQTAIAALNIITNEARDQKLALYNHLGVTTKQQRNYKEALYWYTKALFIVKNPAHTIKIKNNIAVVLIKQKKYHAAIDSLSLLLHTYKVDIATESYATLLSNLGYAKSKSNVPYAEKELFKALTLQENIQDDMGQFSSHMHLTAHYQEQQQSKIALSHAKKAYQIGLLVQSPVLQTKALTYLIQLKDNPKEEAIRYQWLTDSISNAQQNAKNQFAKIKYETEQNRAKIATLKIETAEKDLKITKAINQKLWLIGILLLISSIGVFIYYYMKQQYKIGRINERYTTEKRLAKKVHDEMANDIYHTKKLVKNHVSPTNPAKKEIMNMLDASYLNARDIATETGAVLFGDSFGEALKNLLIQYNNDNVKIINTTKAIDTIIINDYKKTAIYRTVQELMINMNKHSQATTVTIAYKKEGKHNEITYTDNGIGADNIIENRGLHNAVTRMEDIDGSFNFKTSKGNGFKASLTFKT